MDEKEKRHKQHSFDCFCKKTLRFAARDVHEARQRRKRKELLFSEMSIADQNKLVSFDEYFTEEWTFSLFGATVAVRDEWLAIALHDLSEFRRNVILLSYFLGLSDREIAELLSSKRANIQYHRSMALAQLRESLERLEGGY